MTALWPSVLRLLLLLSVVQSFEPSPLTHVVPHSLFARSVAESADEACSSVPFAAACSPTPGNSPFVQTVTTFTTCGTCKAVYVLNQNDIGTGSRVRCSICGNEWHQTPARLHKLFSDFELEPYDEQKKAHYANRQKEPLSSQRFDNNRGTRTAGSANSVFVANLPYKATEEEVAVLFQAVAEHPQVTIVKDNEGRSRGYGFVDLGSNTTVQKAIQTLNGAQVQGRKIVVRMGNGRGNR